VSSAPNPVACPGCGVELPELDAPAPAHLSASPACWALYARLLVREYGDLADGLVHRLTVATYAVQHPDRSRHRSPESTALQLIALCLVLERGASAQRTTTLLASVLEQPPAFPWLEPPNHQASTRGQIPGNARNMCQPANPRLSSSLLPRRGRDSPLLHGPNTTHNREVNDRDDDRLQWYAEIARHAYPDHSLLPCCLLVSSGCPLRLQRATLARRSA
jgi:hypothetical protein